MTELAAEGDGVVVLVRKREIRGFRASVEHATEPYRPHRIEQAFPLLPFVPGSVPELRFR